MNIVAYVHLYVPNHNCGAEVMLHEILIELMKMGHQATVICGNPVVENYQGVDLVNVKNFRQVRNSILKADIIFTHLDFTRQAIVLANRLRKPIVHLIHNHEQVKVQGITEKNSDLIVCNSKWISDTIDLKMKKLIVYPPIKREKYKTKNTDECITLINLTDAKGGNVFWKLVDMLKKRKFIGVIGGYGKQIISEKIYKNVTVYKNTPNIKDIYAKTRILLIPSSYESWGRVGMEAFSSGIPVIAHPTSGLLESLGNAGIFVDRKDIQGYANKIKMLDDPKVYKEYSEKALNRVKEVEEEFQKQIKEFEKEIVKLVK